MKKNTHLIYKNRALAKNALALSLMASSFGALCFSGTAHATGTLAGTDIENVATASYDTPSGPITIDSNKVIIKVDEILDVTIANSDPGDISTTPGAAGNVQKFKVTNTGNGPEAFTLIADPAKTGDDFNPALQRIVLDTNNNGVFDAGVDTIYTPGSNDPLLAPDASVTVFVITDTPTTAADGARAEVNLKTLAKTGTGAPGTNFAGKGEGGSDAVVGTTGADADISGFLKVLAAKLELLKSATVLDPFGGTRAVPGSTITYTIVAKVTGSGSIANLVISDAIPSDTTYLPASTTYEGAAKTDAADADQVNFNGSKISAAAGTVATGQTRTVTFKVKIK
jgi:uncharacterized repeat protein (TIGR01451 family)